MLSYKQTEHSERHKLPILAHYYDYNSAISATHIQQLVNHSFLSQQGSRTWNLITFYFETSHHMHITILANKLINISKMLSQQMTIIQNVYLDHLKKKKKRNFIDTTVGEFKSL